MAEAIEVYRTRSFVGVGDAAALSIEMIEICLVAFGALLLLGSMGAFFLYIPFLPIAVVVAMLLGMVLAFLLGAWVGATRIPRLRSAGGSLGDADVMMAQGVGRRPDAQTLETSA